MSRGETKGGFTLLEITVALAVLGLVLVSALTTAAADLRASRAMTTSIESALMAEELLARVELYSAQRIADLQSGEEGRFESPMDHYRWFVRTALVPGERGLYDVFVYVENPSGGRFPLQTRFARKEGSDEANS